MSNVSISGAISGLDTSSLINQLMTVEAQSQNSIRTKQTAAQKAADAYTTLITSLGSLAKQSETLAKTSAWAGSTATSSSASVTASVTGNTTGTLTFDVTSVAAAHTLVSAGNVASTGTVVAGSSLSVLDGDGVTKGTINVGNGTLAEVVAGINTSDLGLRAAAVQTAPGQFRLQVTSATSGAGSEFSLTGVTGFTPTGMNVLTAGADAELLIGKDPLTQYSVSSSSNTFANLVPGLSFTVSKLETGVTVDAKLDGKAVSTQISSLVDATNATLTSLSTLTAYNFSTRSGGALYGDNSIRGLQQQILSVVGGSAAPGVQLTRDGRLTFDSSAFVKAFEANPIKTAEAYGATSSFTPNTGVLGQASMLSSTNSTRDGSYAVDVSVAAAKEEWQVSLPLDGQVVEITQGSRTASYTVEIGNTLAQTLSAINNRAAAAGISATATENGGGLRLTANSAGTASAFTLSLNAVAGTQVRAGANVVGAIDGESATGTGNVLTLTSTTSRANGLSLIADFSAADVLASSSQVGTVDFKAGLAQRISSMLNDITDSADGALSVAKQGRIDDVKDFQKQIDAWDRRLEARRETLQRQFTAMETALAALRSSSSAITNLLAASPSRS